MGIPSSSKYLFILSHMRSRSSLLAHLLGSHQEICGYRELHMSYKHFLDKLKMRIKLYPDCNGTFRGKYLLDKILDNRHEISVGMFKAMAPKVIFLVREPASTLTSLSNLKSITGTQRYDDPERVSSYYCARLSCLADYAGMKGGDALYVESDDVVRRTDQVLNRLTTWLGLKEPLKSEYKIFKHTGKPGFGDPSQNILAGKVAQPQRNPHTPFPEDLLEEATLSYEQCKKVLKGC